MSSNSNVDINEVLQQLRAGGNMPEELMEIFSEEAEEHMRNIYDGLDRLRVNFNDLEALGDVRRSSHTLKGAAGAVGFEAITRLSHRMEDLLDFLADNKIGPTEHQLQLLLTTADQIEDLNNPGIDFEETAQTLVVLYTSYEEQMQELLSGKTESGSESNSETETNSETEPATEAEQVDAPAADNKPDATVEATEVVEVELEEILEQLESGSEIEPELAEIFEEEAQEHLSAISMGLSKLNENNADTKAMADIRRSSHTLKGAAGAVGLMGISKLSYRVESFLDRLADNSKTPCDEQVQLLNETVELLFELAAGDYELEETVISLAETHNRFERELASLPAEPVEETAAAIEPALPTTPTAVEQTETETAEPQNTAPADEKSNAKPDAKETAKAKSGTGQQQQYLRVPLDRIDSLVALVGEMIVNRSAFNQRLADFEDRIDEMNTSLDRLRSVANEVETQYSVDALQSGSRRNNGMGVNRIKAVLDNSGHEELDSLEFDRYTDFHLLARSLSEATNDVGVITSELRNLHGDFDSLLGRQQRFNRDAQSSLMHIRMVPLGNISNRLERTVRSVSNKLGKKVDLSIVGESTELDKTVLEEITDPLLHLIRNGLDHGIETAEQRVAAGKPERSQLKVEALHQGTQVTIRVIDDGRGINLEKVRQKAIERGLVQEEQTLSKEELHSLIFLPGFSTADSLTDVSGRGVGMDVVREAVQRLKGTIHVDSKPGEGSVFTIHLPTTLAVSRALLVESSGHQFAIPMQSVQQIMRLDPKTVTQVGAHPMINLGDRMLLLKDLANHLEMRSESETFETSKACLLIRTGDDEVAVTIDAICGGQDIVVKTLGDHLREVPGYIGATVSGDGTVIPILDPADLCGQKATTTIQHDFRRHSDHVKTSRKTAMVIDDSLSVRRVTSNLLRSHGWDVLDAKDGVDALEKLAAADTPPDVFLCDMEMPRMDGLELITRIRSQSEFKTTPIAMVTSRSGEKHRRMAREAGANEHVVKPFKEDQLIDLIDQMVASHRELAGV